MKIIWLEKKQNGVSALEFTLIAPFLFVLLFGLIEFGCLFYDKAVITNACREGARAGIVARSPRMSDDEIKQVVLNYAQNRLINFGNNPLSADNIEIEREGYNFGDDLTVRVNYQYKFLVLPNFKNLGWFNLDNVINIRAVTVMRME